MRTLLAAVLLVLAVAAPVRADERLVMDIPKSWQLADDASGQSYKMQLYVPRGQSAKRWTDSIKVEVFGGMADASAKEQAESVYYRYRYICGKLASDPLRLVWDNGYLSTTAFMDCRDLKDFMRKPETGMKSIEVNLFKAIQGGDNLYVVQRQWHADADGPGNPLLSPRLKQQWRDWAASVQVCDPARSDGACGKK